MEDPGAAANRVKPLYKADLFGGLSGRCQAATDSAGGDYPLIVALHGGTFSSLYFDVPGFSLFERAAALGLPVVAPDRPGYGESFDLAADQHTIRGHAAILHDVIGDAWQRYRGSAWGIVLVAHSIGAAIAMTIASERPEWPLLGLCVSGLCLRPPPHSRDAFASFPDLPKVLMPEPVKDMMMFGPPGSFDARMPGASHAADTTVPKREIMDIVTAWPEMVRDVAGRIGVPVHYRQAEFDRLWVVSPAEVADFASTLSASPFVDAAMMPGTGHCMDFHRIGAGFQFQQLGFALQCAAM